MNNFYTSTAFKCSNCGKSYEDHKNVTLNCPKSSRGNARGFDVYHTYSPNKDKPE